ncbi:hypothetical protein AVEN_182329-1 [Araneus ventricosus]|uniref:Uncharacterized protein n=1 Tax=Araneus ventricosus TaxID=182803 RepID=A0A4Y2KA62_ARAVE|nr:hypothetical protein AVEN_182329-1 [Araneus ventricosus]
MKFWDDRRHFYQPMKRNQTVLAVSTSRATHAMLKHPRSAEDHSHHASSDTEVGVVIATVQPSRRRYVPSSE